MARTSATAFVLAALAVGPAGAGQVPGPAAAPDVPVSARDRVYAAEQFSNTVSVIDPAANKLLGVIRLGEPQPANLSPLYRGQVLVHGLGFSPDHRTLAVVSIGSNSVTFIETATNAVKHVTYVGRSPHEAFFTPDGGEVWVTVRGEDYVAVLDGKTFSEKRRIKLANGPGMTIFSPDGKYGFVCSSFTPEIAVGELPHGVWPSGDGTRVYVGIENGDAMTAIDTLENKVIATVPIGQAAQAVVYVPNAVPEGAGTENLMALGVAGQVAQLVLGPAGGTPATRVSLFDQGLTQVLQAAVTGLEARKPYVLALSSDPKGAAELEPLAGFMTNPAGAAIVNAVGPIRQIVQSSGPTPRRYLVIAAGTPASIGAPVQVQQ